MTRTDTPAEEPKPFAYLDYRDFLRDYFTHKKSVDPTFSQRKFIRLAGLPLSTSSLVPAVVNRRRNLSHNQALAFARGMKLKERAFKYFELLVLFNQAKGVPEKNYYFTQLSQFRASRAKTVSQTQLRFFSGWHFAAVRNFFGIRQDVASPAEIARNLHPPLKPAQVREAIALLLDLDLIRKTANGYTVTDKHVSSGPDVRALEAKHHLKELIGLSLRALDEVPAEQRQFNGLMFSVSGKNFDLIKERVRSFQHELRDIVDRDSGEDRVYTLTMQLFPNTQIPKKRSGGARTTPTEVP